MKGGKLERDFQRALIRELKKRFSGCIVTKLDSSHIQGIPDLLILWGKALGGAGMQTRTGSPISSIT